MVLWVFAGTMAFAGGAAAQQLDNRSPTSQTVAPGDTVDVTVEVSSSSQNIDVLEESIVSGSGNADIISASSDTTQVPTSFPSDSLEVVYLSSVDSDTLTYTVEIDSGASDGDTVELSGTIVDSGAGETDTGTTTLTVDTGTTPTPTPTPPASGSASVVGEEVGGDISEALYQGRDGTAYQGQDIIVTGENITENGNYNARSVDSFTTEGGESIVESSSQIEALQTYTEDDDPEEIPAYAQGDLASGEAFLVLDTDDYDAGDVFVRGESLPVNPAESDGTFEIVVQDLSLTFEDDDTPVTDEGDDALAELELDSNRVGYNTNVSAAGDLDDQELIQIFVNTDANGATGDVGGTEYTEGEIESAILDAREYVTTDGDGNLEVDETGTVDINNTDVTVEQLLNSDANPFNALVYDYGDTQPDEKIVLSDISNPEHDIDFANIDDDEYTVTVDVADTTAAASATVQTAVTENPQADDAVFNVSIIETNSPVEEGETLRVTAIIKNTGDVSGTQTINLDMGSLGSDSISVSVDSGVTKTETLTLSTSTGDAGSYPATVSSDNDSASQSITVQEVDDGADPQLDTRDPETVNAHPGETVEITAEYSSDDNKIELYDEMIVTGQEIAEITDATSEKTQGSVSDDKNSASALYISPVNRDTFSVSVKISEDASDGETVELSGTIIGGTGETNAGTTTITIQQGPTLADYANESGIVETDGLLDAIAAWRNDDVGVDLLLDAIDAWRSGNSIE